MTRRFDVVAASAVAVSALILPCTVLAIAWATSFRACLDSMATEACGRRGLATAQFLIACAGFLPVLMLAASLRAGGSRLAWVAFAGMIVVYALWALLNDAATHGWDDLRLLP